MIGDYDDDDNHFCLKCHETINGLDNYVSHRKNGCTNKNHHQVEPPKSPLPSQLLPPGDDDDESFNLKADDFFSSLELQSSSKKPTAQSTAATASSSSLSTGNSKNIISTGILTRSKTSAVIHQTQIHQHATGNNSSHHNIINNKEELPQSKSGKNVWIGGHQLKLGHGDNQSKLIKAVDNLERRKEDPPRLGEVFADESDLDSEDYDYDVLTSDDDHDGPPRHHTGGKWKPSSPISWNRVHDWDVPPAGYTGGKWKPKRNLSPPPSHTKGKWKPVDETLTTTSPSTSSFMVRNKSPSITKVIRHEDNLSSKFESLKASKSIKIQNDEDNNDNLISPNYTGGKWLPNQSDQGVKKISTPKITDDSPFRKSSGTVQYWCRPCNRSLSSKLVYEKHLKSELHFKRTLNDREFDDINIIKHKRPKKTAIYQTAKKELISSPNNIVQKLKRRQRTTIFIKCDVCNSKVNKTLLGKHLISHYHCRQADLSTIESQQIILDNIDSIIRQSPYQCGVCKYYFNFHQEFLQHWLSPDHLGKQTKKPGIFWCNYCKFQNTNNNEMYKHLIGKEHDEVVAAINRSVPIVIKKITFLSCLDCSEQFLLNIERNKHCQKENHQIPLTNTDHICIKCNQVFKSIVSLSRHRLTVHKENAFICSICNLQFKSSAEAKDHRKSIEHRHKTDKTTIKSCKFCSEITNDFVAYKAHLLSKHQEHCTKCPKCGEIFAIPQDLSVHLRTKSCKIVSSSNTITTINNDGLDALSSPDKKSHSCQTCSYSSNSQSELWYHEILHNEPLSISRDQTKQSASIVHYYKCHLCQTLFQKSSLLGHLRWHSKERPFKCTQCTKAFVRKNNLLCHVKRHGAAGVKTKKAAAGNQRPFLCSICGASFQRKSILQQHQTVHSGKLFKCPDTGCIFSARTMSELKIHYQIHSDAKNFTCDICDYKGKTKQQLTRHKTVHDLKKKYQCPKCTFSTRIASHLKRHSLVHTGSKPFNCPHCAYKCNNLENLRKHVLSTKKHPGKCIYECKFCPNEPSSVYQSNFAKEFKAHLITQHADMFGNGADDAATYIAGIYKIRDEFAENSPEEKSVTETKQSTHHQEDNTNLKFDGEIPSQRSESNTSAAVRQDETFSMFLIPKHEGGSEHEKNTTSSSSGNWNLVASYDIEEEGSVAAMISLDNDSRELFQGHFQ